jgi:predicted acetyltransferase
LIDRTQALAVLPDVYDRARRLQPGAIDRSAALWHSILRDSPQRDQSDGPRFYVTYESARVRTLSQLDGAAVYRIKERWADDLPANVLTVREVLATTPQAYAALWQYLLSVDLVGAVRAEERPVDEPLRWLLVEPRRLRTTRLGDELWVRLLDIPMALTARRYATRDALVFEVHDALRPQIGGRYALDGSPEGATCRPTTSSPDLVLGVAELGATYLGGVTFSTLTRAGRVEEVTAGALRRADTLFAAERAPFCGTSF